MDPKGLNLYDCDPIFGCDTGDSGDYSGAGTGFANPGNPSWDSWGQAAGEYGDQTGGCPPEFEICDPIASIVTPPIGIGGGGGYGNPYTDPVPTGSGTKTSRLLDGMQFSALAGVCRDVSGRAQPVWI